MTRRRLLIGGLGLAAGATATGAGMITDVLPGGPPLRRALGMTGPDGTLPDAPPGPMSIVRVYSTARGREVDLITMYPAGASGTLRLCLALHGRGGTARGLVDLGLPRFLTAAVRDGVPPFAITAVDCGDNYYVPRDGDDPLRLLAQEVAGWLFLPPQAAIGLSMGGYGALNLTRRRPLVAVAVASPALFQDWPDARSRNAFTDERQWHDTEPLRHVDDLAGTSLGVWCGTEDPFVDAARELIDTAHPERAVLTRGAHDNDCCLRHSAQPVVRNGGSGRGSGSGVQRPSASR